MREGALSAGVLPFADVPPTTAQDAASPLAATLREPRGWNPENFAREQIRGLVRQVFFSTAAQPVRQVVFSAVEPQTDLRSLCRRVGEALALETQRMVAVVRAYPRPLQELDAQREEPTERATKDAMPLRQVATHVRPNLWLVPEAERLGDWMTSASLHSYLGEVRRQFEYSIVEGPCAGGSDGATAMAQFADGIILVLSASHTRRAAARKIKAELEAAQVRILGIVLSDRVFPIPEAIYRRL
jgi:hypothetical protein